MKPILEYIISKTSKVINHITLEDFEKELREKCNDSNDDTLIKNIIEELKNQSKEYVEIICTFVNLLIKNGYKIVLGLSPIQFENRNLQAVQIIKGIDGYIIFAFINIKESFILSIGMRKEEITVSKTNVKDKKEFISLLDKKKCQVIMIQYLRQIKHLIISKMN